MQSADDPQREALNRGQGPLALILELIPFAVFWKDRESRYLGCNRTFADLAELESPQDIVGKDDFDLPWAREESEAYRADDAQVMDSGQAKVHIMETQTTAEGMETWLDTSKVPLRDGSGKVVGVLGVYADVTAQRQTESQLQNTRQHLEDAIEALDAGIVLYDKEERLVFCNETYREIYADARGVIEPGRTYGEILRDFARNNEAIPSGLEERWVQDRLAQHRRCQQEWYQEMPDKTIRISDCRTADGGVVSLRTDVTELKRIERDMRLAKDQAEAANQAKSGFLANMSHEIRTPMTAILGFSEILLTRMQDPEDVQAVNTILRNGEHLLSLINDILDLSKVEAAKLDVVREDIDLPELLYDVVGLMEVRAQAKSIPLELEFDGPVPRMLFTDAARVRQILINLVGNAIKFTEVGGVRVTAQYRLRNQTAQLHLAVRDSGIGMNAEQTERIFQPFEQADSSTTRKYGGTGLGLAISMRLAELLGGSLSVESTPQVGSTFQLTLPVEARPEKELVHPVGGTKGSPEPVAPLPTSTAQVESPLAGKRILLAEDGRDNQLLLSTILRKAGAEVILANNGSVALEEIFSRQAGLLPLDLILMDMQMPVMDGYEATRQLRSAGIRLPILALTAHAMESDRQLCLAAGCDDFLSKPVRFPTLIKTCADWLLRTAA